VLLARIQRPVGVGQAAAQLVADGLALGERGEPVLDVGVELPHEFGQIGPGLAGGGGELVLVSHDGALLVFLLVFRERVDDVLEGGQAGLLAGAARLFGAHGGFWGPGELGHGQGLPPPGHHGLLGSQAIGQRPERLLGLPLPEEVESLPEGVGRLGRARVGEQPGLLAERGAVAGAVGGVVDAQ
jgi:hypothetical protein